MSSSLFPERRWGENREQRGGWSGSIKLKIISFKSGKMEGYFVLGDVCPAHTLHSEGGRI